MGMATDTGMVNGMAIAGTGTVMDTVTDIGMGMRMDTGMVIAGVGGMVAIGVTA